MGTPEKFQISKTKPQKMPEPTARMLVFELGDWCFLGAWSLEFGAFCLSSQLLKNSDAPFAVRNRTFYGGEPITDRPWLSRYGASLLFTAAALDKDCPFVRDT